MLAGMEAAGTPSGVSTGDAVRLGELHAAQRRALPVLGAMQVLGGVGVASGIAVNGLLAQELSGSTSQSGLAQTMAVLGAAVLAVPLARLAGARGRRPALAVGYLIAAVGAALSIAAGVAHAFWLLLVGAALFGGGSAVGLQSRYAALDAAAADRRARSLSLVLWAGTVGSVLGPNLSDVAGRLGRSLGLTTLTGPFLFSLTGFLAAMLVGWLFLRPDPLVVAQRLGNGHNPGPRAGLRRAVAAVRSSRTALLGLVAVGTAHAVMVGVMIMTPVHLHDHGATLRVIGLVISVHILGMYAASPLMGWLTDWFGPRRGILAGIAVLLLACGLAATGPTQDDVRLGIALTLLGLGWSSCLVAGSTLVSSSVEDDVRTAVQGLSDLVMGVVAASAGVLAGPVLQEWGYPTLAVAAAVLLAPVLVLAISTAAAAPAAAPTAGSEPLEAALVEGRGLDG